MTPTKLAHKICTNYLPLQLNHIPSLEINVDNFRKNFKHDITLKITFKQQQVNIIFYTA